jgi:hypothetical protein
MSLILDHSYLVDLTNNVETWNLTNSKIAETKALEPPKITFVSAIFELVKFPTR